jgi:uracil-DNA glycosylase
MVVCLGSTAARALLGASVKVTRDRGKVFTAALAPWVLPTYHPSALLRAPRAQRERARTAFREDLETVAARYLGLS